MEFCFLICSLCLILHIGESKSRYHQICLYVHILSCFPLKSQYIRIFYQSFDIYYL